MTTINTIEDLVRILDERPDWNEAIRARVLSHELLNLPQTFAEFAERTERRLAVLEATLAEFVESTNRRLAALEEGQARIENDVAGLKEGQAKLEEGQARIENDVAGLKEGQAKLEEGQARIENDVSGLKEGQAKLEEGQARIENDVSGLKEGQTNLAAGQANLAAGQARIERDVATLKAAHARNGAFRITRHISRIVNCRQIRLLEDGEILDGLDAADTAGIPQNELQSFGNADIIIEAKHRDTGETHYIAVEASYTASRRDTDRAIRNAQFLTRFTGQPSHAVVASQRIRPDIEHLIESGAVRWVEIPQEVLETD